MKPRTRIKQISDKRAAAHPELRFSTIARPTSPPPRPPWPYKLTLKPRRVSDIKKSPKPKSRIKKKPRTPEEYARIYGSKSRVEWVKSLPSIVSGRGPCDNVHVVTGGTGYKADAQFIVPLTRAEHRVLHTIGVASFEAKYHVSLTFEADLIDRRWRSLLVTNTDREDANA